MSAPEPSNGAQRELDIGSHFCYHLASETSATTCTISHPSSARKSAPLTTAVLINTHGGHYIWDCQAPFTLGLAAHLASLQPALKAIVISHPHVSSRTDVC